MSTLTIQQQKPADKIWLDEEGTTIPYARITQFERKREVSIFKMAKDALLINDKLSSFKQFIKTTCEQLYSEFLASNNGKIQGKGKGGITLYNFDRSIKVEVSINEPIHFDESFIKLAKAELDAIFADELESASAWIRDIISDAFEKNRGELDTDKVLSLKKHASRVPAHIKPRYDKAMGFIDQAINRPTSKEYYRVWVRGDDGQYKNIQLNFSSI
ncbi:DUF3164 family protein [Mucilaginibacter glaciei]|uniref:DUF3164 family protein n=1 Tax=Mucilaginibacter glaciei TaxID=2772109 RepID=A0A926NYL6_9SPHI|nr:DUF3164 family protein [Mucilaginibacter glaciei]MBD1394288.1 DUF3164 family protein [Mucilaginibacter glaciei]